LFCFAFCLYCELGDWHQQNQKLYNTALGNGTPFIPLPAPPPSEIPPTPTPPKIIKKRPPPPPLPSYLAQTHFHHTDIHHIDLPLASFPNTQSLAVGPGVSLFYNSYTNAAPNLQNLNMVGAYQTPTQFGTYYSNPYQIYPTYQYLG